MGYKFSLDSPFMQICATLADLVILNILWLVCCIPIFTIGAATTAMYRVTIQLHRGEGSGIFKEFFRSFSLNFKQSTILWLIMLLILAILTADILILLPVHSVFLLALPAIGILLWLFVNVYLFPLVSQFYNSNKQMVKNALILSLRNLPRSLLTIILQVSPLILALTAFDFFYKSSFIWIIIGGSGIAYINTMMINPILSNLPE